MGNYCITIARGYGSGGSHIAKQLSQKLGIPYYDTELLTMAAEKSGIPEATFLAANEKISDEKLKFAPKFDEEVDLYAPLPSSDPKYTSGRNIFALLASSIRDLACKESCIIIGKASNQILAGYDNVFKINIVAPMDKCISNITKRNNLSEEEALEKITKTDKYRRNYTKYYTGKDWNDPMSYDLIVNTGSISEDIACDFIETIIKEKFCQQISHLHRQYYRF